MRESFVKILTKLAQKDKENKEAEADAGGATGHRALVDALPKEHGYVVGA